MNSYRFSASARLGVWFHLHRDHETFISNLDKILSANSHSVLESNDIDFIPTDNSSIASLTSILDKIIIRGIPTLTNPSFEHFLLTSSSYSDNLKFPPILDEDDPSSLFG